MKICRRFLQLTAICRTLLISLLLIGLSVQAFADAPKCEQVLVLNPKLTAIAQSFHKIKNDFYGNNKNLKDSIERESYEQINELVHFYGREVLQQFSTIYKNMTLDAKTENQIKRQKHIEEQIEKVTNFNLKKLHQFKPELTVQRQAVDYDNQRIAISMAKSIFLYDFEGNSLKRMSNANFTGSVNKMYFSSDKNSLILVGNFEVRILNIINEISIKFPGPESFNQFVIAPHSDLLAFSIYTGEVLVYDINGSLLKTFEGKKEVHSMQFSEDSRRLITVNEDGFRTIYDLNSKQKVESQPNDAWKRLVVTSPNEKFVASKSYYPVLELFDSNGQSFFKKEFEAEINHILFTPDSLYVIAILKNGSIKAFSTVDGGLMFENNVAERNLYQYSYLNAVEKFDFTYVRDPSLSPDGTKMTLTNYNEVFVFDTSLKKVVK